MFTLAEFRKFLKTLPPNETLPFSFHLASWRGSYDEPALIIKFLVPEFSTFTAAQALENLELEGKTFQGYKGGDYTFRDSQMLHLETCESNYLESASAALAYYYPKLFRYVAEQRGISFPSTNEAVVSAVSDLKSAVVNNEKLLLTLDSSSLTVGGVAYKDLKSVNFTLKNDGKLYIDDCTVAGEDGFGLPEDYIPALLARMFEIVLNRTYENITGSKHLGFEVSATERDL